MRRALDNAEPDDPAQPPEVKRRQAMQEFETLGVLYALLNYLAPLVRFTALLAFFFGSVNEFRELLGVVMAAIGIGMSRPLLLKLGGQLTSDGGDGAATDEHEASSHFHQVRLVWSQGLRVALFVVLYLLALLVFDPRPFLGLHGHAAALGQPTPGAAADGSAVAALASADDEHEYSHAQLVGLGLALSGAWSVVWSLVHRVAPREKLTMAAGTHDLSAAGEDDLLRAMPPRLRALSLTFRMAAIGFDALADVLLVFVFLPSRLEGLHVPSSVRPSPPLSLVLCALTYGSQHLRFRGEWLLCSMYGAALGGVTHMLGGQLLPALVGATSFAVLRHARRMGLDARQVHAE